MNIKIKALPEIHLVSSGKSLLSTLLPGLIFGMIRNLCPIFIMVMGGMLFLREIGGEELFAGLTTPVICVILLAMAVMGGLFYYGKKSCSRRVGTAPLVSVGEKVYGADVVLSQTIVVLTVLVLVIYIGHYHVLSGVFALVSCLFVAFVIPWLMGRHIGQKEAEVRAELDELKDFVLDTLEGMDEIRQYDQRKVRQQQMNDRSKHLSFLEKNLSNAKGVGKSDRNLAVLLLSFGMMFLHMYLYEKGSMDFAGAVLSTIAMMGTMRLILY